MDGDLQHPPALVPRMLAWLQSSGADLVVASRYWQQGAASGLNRPRTLVSRFAAGVARLLFRWDAGDGTWSASSSRSRGR